MLGTSLAKGPSAVCPCVRQKLHSHSPAYYTKQTSPLAWLSTLPHPTPVLRPTWKTCSGELEPTSLPSSAFLLPRGQNHTKSCWTYHPTPLDSVCGHRSDRRLSNMNRATLEPPEDRAKPCVLPGCYRWLLERRDKELWMGSNSPFWGQEMQSSPTLPSISPAPVGIQPTPQAPFPP